MTRPFVFEKPVGFRDILPGVVEKKTKVLDLIQHELRLWGYEFIETPTLEYFDTVGGFSSTMEQRLFKLLDRMGKQLVLRPDMTAPIARVVASLLKEKAFPIRLAYQGNVFRAQENEAGRNAEFMELGIELVGEDAPDADAEVITLAIAALEAAKVKNFTLAVGHIGFMNALLAENLAHQEKVVELRQYLQNKNYVGYRSFVEQESISDEKKENLLSLLELCGGAQQIEKAKKLAKGKASPQAISELEELWNVLELHGVTKHVMIDLRLIAQRDYYTGVLFEGYADRLGFPVCSGGRYNNLLEKFGRPAPATGFSLKVDRILEVSELEIEKKSKKIFITYTDKQREQAYQQARALRKDNCYVTLHRLSEAQTELLEQTIGVKQQEYDEHIHLAGGVGKWQKQDHSW